jgi:signal recognition particle receptor subunit beta
MIINQASKEITAKIVYYGPALSGKTTNLQYLHEYLEPSEKGKLLSISTEGDRTIFFDFMPIDLGEIKGFKVRLQLYTVPGQVIYEETRRRVIKGTDGIVFVADSQKKMAKANKDSFEQMKAHLSENGINPDKFPIVLQFNKRDIKDIMTFEEMDKALNPGSLPFFEAIATEGVGVEDTLKSISKLVMNNILAQITETQKISKQKPSKDKDQFFAMDTKKLLKEIGVNSSKKEKIENLFVDEPHQLDFEDKKKEEEVIFDQDSAETNLLGSEDDSVLLLTEDEEIKHLEDDVDTGNYSIKEQEISLKSGDKLKLSIDLNGKKYSLTIELKEE